MKSMVFNNFVLNYHEFMNVYVNDTTKKVVFISEDEDEIHGILELDENNKVKIYPRWNVNFLIEDTKVTIGVNYENE